MIEVVPNGSKWGKIRSEYLVTCDVCGKEWRRGLGWDPLDGSTRGYEVLKLGAFKRAKVVCNSHTDKEIAAKFPPELD